LIKKLDILLIRSFVGPFIVTFFVSLFVLMMQFFWLYMDEMIGKGISVWMLIQLLGYMSTTLVPLALPLAVLLSSIMTFGNMGENFELVAIKSSGISLLRFMQPLLIFILFLSGLAFIFSNNVIPVANLKALSLLYDVRNKKPAMNIRADQFLNDIQGFSIRVGSKDPENNIIRDIVIYDHSDMNGNNKVVLAREGEMISTADKQTLIFKLRDGWQYYEGFSKGSHDLTQTRMHFDQWDKVFDLSSFKFTRTNEEMFKTAYQMMNVQQLSESIDSIKRTGGRMYSNISNYVSPYISIDKSLKESPKLVAMIKADKNAPIKYDSTFMEHIPDTMRSAVVQTTLNNLRNLKSLMDVSCLENKLQMENFYKFGIEFHRKFTLSVACIVLFLIGAPLGAIIRKGGLGMPLVLAVVFFIAFHILNIFGEKMAKAYSVLPWVGMWMPTAVLTPIALVLVTAARNDSRIFSKEWYFRNWKKIRRIGQKTNHMA
jgi:lipopolysaccharide export system permease protein